MSKESELTNKIINLDLTYFTKESDIYLKHLYNRIKFYESQIQNLNKNKIFKFQKKKQKEYNDKLEEYNKIIIELYVKIEEEINLITELNKNIK